MKDIARVLCPRHLLWTKWVKGLSGHICCQDCILPGHATCLGALDVDESPTSSNDHLTVAQPSLCSRYFSDSIAQAFHVVTNLNHKITTPTDWLLRLHQPSLSLNCDLATPSIWLLRWNHNMWSYAILHIYDLLHPATAYSLLRQWCTSHDVQGLIKRIFFISRLSICITKDLEIPLTITCFRLQTATSHIINMIIFCFNWKYDSRNPKVWFWSHARPTMGYLWWPYHHFPHWIQTIAI